MGGQGGSSCLGGPRLPTLPSGTLATHPGPEILRPRRCCNRGVEELLCSRTSCSSPRSKALLFHYTLTSTRSLISQALPGTCPVRSLCWGLRMERKQAGLVPHLTSRMSTEVREGPTASLPPSGPDGWERPGLRTQRPPRGKCGSKSAPTRPTEDSSGRERISAGEPPPFLTRWAGLPWSCEQHS